MHIDVINNKNGFKVIFSHTRYYSVSHKLHRSFLISSQQEVLAGQNLPNGVYCNSCFESDKCFIGGGGGV